MIRKKIKDDMAFFSNIVKIIMLYMSCIAICFCSSRIDNREQSSNYNTNNLKMDAKYVLNKVIYEKENIVLSSLENEVSSSSNSNETSNKSRVLVNEDLYFKDIDNSNEQNMLLLSPNAQIDTNGVMEYVSTDNMLSNIAEVEEIKYQEELKRQEEERIQQEQERIRLEKEQEAKEKKQIDAGFLIAIDNPDVNYQGCTWSVDDRDLLERLVTGEYGSDYLGAVLVAQTIRDTMVSENSHSVSNIISSHSYSGSTNMGISENAKKAVAFVFDQGGAGVQHRLKCFYASNLCSSSWHEKQNFVVQRNYVRFFDY